MLKITKIIVEGPDCSGKSTLVERLKNSLHWDSRYLRHKNTDQFLRYLKEYANDEIVFDRSHFSEIVYSKMWRGGSPFSKDENEILDKISFLDSIVIFAIPSQKEIKKRYKSRSFDQQITFEELKESRELFVRQMKKHNCFLYRSRNYDELDKLIEKVNKMVKGE